MSRMYPEYFDADPFGCSVAADSLFRQEPDQEEDEEEERDDDKGNDEGYSE